MDKKMNLISQVIEVTGIESIGNIFVKALFVIEQSRGSGIARSILSKMKDNLDFHTFATPDSVSWYEQNGFRQLGNH